MNAFDIYDRLYDQMHAAFGVRGELLRKIGNGTIGNGTPTPIEARYLKQLDDIIRKNKTMIRWYRKAVQP